MQKKSRVAILLSTYNGERFLRQQLDSLLAQSYPFVEIYIRDDGSTDGTLDILREFASKNQNVTLCEGMNVGFVASFFQLLADCQPASDYYFFCDQDDVWLPNKVSRAVEMLGQSDQHQPQLYCSRLQCVDSGLNPLYLSEIPDENKIGFGNALVQNVATGCTVAINKKARYIFLSQPLPNNCLAHDWWMYLLVSCFGSVIADSTSFIYYRQHDSNVIGMKEKNIFYRVKKFIFRKKTFDIFDQARCFLDLYGKAMPESKRKDLIKFISYSDGFLSSVRLSFCDFYWRSKETDDFMLRLLIAFRRY